MCGFRAVQLIFIAWLFLAKHCAKALIIWILKHTISIGSNKETDNFSMQYLFTECSERREEEHPTQ